MSDIPGSVIALLKHQWQTSNGYSAFEANADHGRLRDPSFYAYRKDQDLDPEMDLSYQEVRRLARDDQFSQHITGNGDTLMINEHVQHALADFCRDVYDAWSKCTARIDKVPTRKPGAG